MADILREKLQDLTDEVDEFIGHLGTYELPVNGMDKPLDRIAVSCGGIVLPKLTMHEYIGLEWRNAVREDTRLRFPDKEEYDGTPESYEALYVPGMVLVSRRVAVGGSKSRDILPVNEPIQIDWGQSEAYVLLGENGRNIAGLNYNPLYVRHQQESGMPIIGLRGTTAMSEEDVDRAQGLVDRLRTTHDARIKKIGVASNVAELLGSGKATDANK